VEPGVDSRAPEEVINNLFLVIVSCAVLAVPPAALQPGATGTVAGVAVDNNGGVLPGVTVVVTAGGREFKTVTDPQGRYILAVPAGSLAVSATLAGFRRLEKRLELEPGANIRCDFTLCPSGVTEIDWIAPPENISEFFATVHTVAYVRVLTNDGRGAACEMAAARLTTTVLERLKPAKSPDPTLTFWQEQWLEEPTPYPVGAGLIVFLDEWNGRLVRSHGPSSVFVVEDGKVRESRLRHHPRYNGMPVEQFLRELRPMK